MSFYRDFIQDLKQLLHAGVPLIEALDTLGMDGKGTDQRGRLAIRLRDRVKAGATLAEALEGAAKSVPPDDMVLIEAGERAGALDKVLGRIVEAIDRRRALLAACIPKTVHAILTLVLAVLLLPLYHIFQGNVSTYARIEASFFIPLILVVLLAWKRKTLFREGGQGRRLFERIALGLPWVGSLIIEQAIGRAFSLLAILLEAGLPIGEAISLAARAARWGPLEQGLHSSVDLIRGGKTLTEAFRAVPLIAARPSWLARVATGEKAGSLDRSLRELGSSLEESASRRLERLLRVLPVFIILLVGAYILYGAIGAFSPRIDGF